MTIDARKILLAARNAARPMAQLSVEQKNQALTEFAAAVKAASRELLHANKKDLKASQGKLSAALMARLELTSEKIEMVCKMILNVQELADPTGKVLRHMVLDDGLVLMQKTVPLGVLVAVFESRPDIIPQISALVLKSGNCVVMKGGSEARHTNQVFAKIWRDVGKKLSFLPSGWVQQVGGRDEFRSLLSHHDLIDLVIPRGSNALVSSVMKHTQAPVLGHAEGICTLYIHKSADLDKALEIVIDAKLQSPSTCNAIETLLVDESVARDFLTGFSDAASELNLNLRACTKSHKFLKTAKKASQKDFRTEFGDARLAVKVVKTVDEAIAHINSHSSHHTDGIVAQDRTAIQTFIDGVDSASIMVNASTRFADGYRYGLGAEVGISTSKIHVRGPAGLEALTTTKFVVVGSGHVVSDYVGAQAKPFKHKSLFAK